MTEALADRRHLVTSVIEHPATTNPCRWPEQHGWRVSRIGFDNSGQVQVGHVAAALAADTAIVTIMHANNETGVVQPIADIALFLRWACRPPRQSVPCVSPWGAGQRMTMSRALQTH